MLCYYGEGWQKICCGEDFAAIKPEIKGETRIQHGGFDHCEIFFFLEVLPKDQDSPTWTPAYIYESDKPECRKKRQIQKILNRAGAADLVVDLIMKNPSHKVFVQSVELAIALLDGGNTEVQVSAAALC